MTIIGLAAALLVLVLWLTVELIRDRAPSKGRTPKQPPPRRTATATALAHVPPPTPTTITVKRLERDLDALNAYTDRVEARLAEALAELELRDDAGADVKRGSTLGEFEINNPAGAPPLDHWRDEYDGDLTWLINTAGSSLAHYAMWPARLAERLVLSMCPAEVCRECGQPRRRIVAIEPSPIPAELRTRSHRHLGTGAVGVRHDQSRSATTLGWSDCGHGTYRPGHVLDPFAGTGTTLAVADIHGRDATGIDLDPAASGLYERRYQECWHALKPGPSPVTEQGRQLDLLKETSS